MLKIGLLSDTHAWWDDKYAEYFAECDEIWHAGDIGSDGLAAKLAALKPFRAVYGNIDGQSLRLEYPEVAHFKAEEVNVMMTHIGGYPGRYNPAIRKELYDTRPNLFIAGHSQSRLRPIPELFIYQSGRSRQKRLPSGPYPYPFCD